MSIQHFSLIRNVGQFDSVSVGAQLSLGRLALVYGENGRGKTTITAILRSLRDGAPQLVDERRRLNAPSAPHIVIDCGGGPSPAIYQSGAWNRTVPELVVFDDKFVDDNVYSGLAVEAAHRQHLNEVILGDQGIALNRALQVHATAIDQHNRNLRQLSDAIPASARGNLSPDDFCAVQPNSAVDEQLQEAEKALAAVHESATIQQMPLLVELDIPPLDVNAVAELVARDLPSLDSGALAAVEQHVQQLGSGAEKWLAEGVQRLDDATPASEARCPFCAQSIDSVALIDHYRNYFSAQYSSLIDQISKVSEQLDTSHGDEANRRFAQAVESNRQHWQYWGRFSELPSIDFNLEDAREVWSRAYTVLRDVIASKKGRPLDRFPRPEESLPILHFFDDLRARLGDINTRVQEANRAIRLVKERAVGGNAAALNLDITRLRAQKSRMDPAVDAACTAYLSEHTAKVTTEQLRDQARANLDNYRDTVFPAYENTINWYLQRLNADFRVASVSSTNIRSGASCSYCFVVNNANVQLTSPATTAGPSFRTALSAGDRNTLALSFFFASLDHDIRLADKIIVIDDPMTSLDEHRLLATAQEIRRLSIRTAQVIVLSHDKPFLAAIWDGANRSSRTAMQIVRDGPGSTLRAWDVSADLVSEHDRRVTALIAFVESNSGDARDVAESLRPVLERYFRTSYPDQFGPDGLLGPFVDRCRGRQGGAGQILSQGDIDELDDLKQYANRFHHDTNAAASTESINNSELLGFARRVFVFIRRPI
jgi:wobble nucleotide-excising tRNase